MTNIGKMITMINKSPLERSLKDCTANTNVTPPYKQLLDISGHTFIPKDQEKVMKHIWNRLDSEKKKWRKIYKTLTLIEYLIKNGSPKCIEDLRQGSDKIARFKNFIHSENNEDKGVAIRDLARRIVFILNDPEYIKDEREKAERVSQKIQELPGYGSSPIQPKPKKSSVKPDDFFEMARQASDSSSKSSKSQSEKEKKPAIPPLDMTKAHADTIPDDEKKTERAITPSSVDKENKREDNPANILQSLTFLKSKSQPATLLQSDVNAKPETPPYMSVNKKPEKVFTWENIEAGLQTNTIWNSNPFSYTPRGDRSSDFDPKPDLVEQYNRISRTPNPQKSQTNPFASPQANPFANKFPSPAQNLQAKQQAEIEDLMNMRPNKPEIQLQNITNRIDNILPLNLNLNRANSNPFGASNNLDKENAFMLKRAISTQEKIIPGTMNSFENNVFSQLNLQHVKSDPNHTNWNNWAPENKPSIFKNQQKTTNSAEINLLE